MSDESGEFTIDIGTADTGYWCGECNLSTEVRFPLSHVTDRGVSSLGHVSFCTEHEALNEGATMSDGWFLPKHEQEAS